ncbi:MAG: HAD family phosphatase [Candidatus Omnitrophica bacterium]|nr:HAD family phosphatase [Candidatus Omnitrophota bacterium]
MAALTPSPFSLILLDLGNVILPFDLRIAMRKFEKECGIPSEEIFHKLMGRELDRSFENGKITPQMFYENVKKELRMEISYDRFVTIWSDIFSENEKVSALVRILKRRFPLVIVSNTNPLHFEFVFRNFPIVREIGQFVLSYEVGCRKPDPKIYQAALDRFGAALHKTLYIDDLEKFVEAGRQLGFYGIHFTGSDQLERELTDLGLLMS